MAIGLVDITSRLADLARNLGYPVPEITRRRFYYMTLTTFEQMKERENINLILRQIPSLGLQVWDVQ